MEKRVHEMLEQSAVLSQQGNPQAGRGNTKQAVQQQTIRKLTVQLCRKQWGEVWLHFTACRC